MPEPVAGREGEVSVVVCTYSSERQQMLKDLLRSIGAGTLQPREVVVVVDRNRALLDALVAERWLESVRVLPSRGSGLAAARNTGWRAVSTHLVAFIDDDAVASPGWLEELVAAANQHGADVVGGWIEPRWAGSEPAWFSPMLGWVVGCSYEEMPKVPSRVRNVIGCNMLIRRELLERLGGFDTSFGRMGRGLAGCEETEFCIRANRDGAQVCQIPGASVAQVLPPTRATLSYAVRRGWHEGHSKRLLVALHGPVLGTEARYARALLRQAATRLGRGIVGLSVGEVGRGLALMAVLGATTLSYLLHGVMRSAPRSG